MYADGDAAERAEDQQRDGREQQVVRGRLGRGQESAGAAGRR